MPRLASVDELKAVLRIPLSESSLDVQLGDLLDEVGDECERITGRTFTEGTFTDEPHPGGCDSIVLKNRPVSTSPAPVVSEVDAFGSTSVLDANEYLVDYAFGIIRLRPGRRFVSGPVGTVLVTYDAGYAASGTGNTAKIAVPPSLSRSAKDLAAARFLKDRGAMEQKDLDAAEERARRFWAGFGY